MASRSASVIDLTQEPDSPEFQPRTLNSSRRGQQQSGQQSGQPVQVIDLTEIVDDDDDDDDEPTISWSRTLPGRNWSPFSGANAGAGGSGSGAAHNANSGSRSMLGFANAFGAGGLEGLARFTNYALDNIPSLGSSGGSVSGHDARSGRPQGIASRRRPTRQASSSSAWRASGSGAAGGGGRSAGVRGGDVFFGAASLGSLLNPLGGNQPDLNYESNGYFNLRQHIHQQYRHHLQPQMAAQNTARAHQLNGPNAYGVPHPMSISLNFGGGGGGGGGGSGAAAMADPDKPPYVAPADPPSGFTRSTGEDLVAVCVSCDEELLYDSNQGNDGGKEGEPTSKRKQSRKERAEHPFWAVTGCGHVYCRRCFDNRRNVLKGTRLPAVEFKTDGKLVYCAAENCTVDVTPKKAWVGLFA